MALTDPLLKELKSYIAIIVQTGPDSLEEHGDLVFSLCYCLEHIFSKGLERREGFTPWKTDAFQWFYQLARKYNKILPLEFKLIFEDVLANPKTRTPVGKARYLIRSCLKKKCLHVPIQFHIENEDFLNPNLHINYNPENSIMGHEILVQIFCSLVEQLSFYNFAFDLTNSSFLDESWQLPAVVKAEMVPCTQIGLTLGFPLGFSVIVEILENSCAAELGNQISVGDILDEINGASARYLYGKKIDELFKKIRSQPFQLSFIRGRNPKTGQIYLPVIKLYRILGLDPLLLGANNSAPAETGCLGRPSPLPSNECFEEPFDQVTTAEVSSERDLVDGTIKPEIHNLEEADSPQQKEQTSSNPKSPQSQKKQQPRSPSAAPQSQNNNSSPTSALNLQMCNPDADQLIV